MRCRCRSGCIRLPRHVLEARARSPLILVVPSLVRRVGDDASTCPVVSFSGRFFELLRGRSRPVHGAQAPPPTVATPRAVAGAPTCVRLRRPRRSGRARRRSRTTLPRTARQPNRVPKRKLILIPFYKLFPLFYTHTHSHTHTHTTSLTSSTSQSDRIPIRSDPSQSQRSIESNQQ